MITQPVLGNAGGQQVEILVVFDFLIEKYLHKSVATRIPRDAG